MKYIDKEKLLKDLGTEAGLKDGYAVTDGDPYLSGWFDAVKSIAEYVQKMQDIDIITCDECRYYKKDHLEQGKGRCDNPKLGRGICFICKSDWFCGDGKGRNQ